jgi:hypothetical protein
MPHWPFLWWAGSHDRTVMSTAAASRPKGLKPMKPKKSATKVAETTGSRAVALAVRKALLRKPKINQALVKLFKSHRDLV